MTMRKLITGGISGNGGFEKTFSLMDTLNEKQQSAALSMMNISNAEKQRLASNLGLNSAIIQQAAAQTGATTATTGGAMAQTGLTTAQTAGTASTIGLTGALKTLWATMLSNPILLITMALTVGIVA